MQSVNRPPKEIGAADTNARSHGTTDDVETRAQALEAARAALEKRGENLVVLDIKRLSGFTDYFVICTAQSDRQAQAIADSVQSHIKTQFNLRPLSTEGYSEGRWILLDFGAFVVHVFQDALRDYYRLDLLWADAVKIPIPSEFYGPSGAAAATPHAPSR